MSKIQSLLINDGNGTSFNFNLLMITQKGDFDNLFKKAEKIRGVTYMASPKLVLDYFEKKNLFELELIIGDRDNNFRSQLSSDIANKLEQLKREGKLRIYLTDKDILHSKFFIVEKNGTTDFINGSANLTLTAQKATPQKNSEIIFEDIEKNPELLSICLNHYEEHKEYAKLFLDDLTNMIDNEPEKSRVAIIKEYLDNGGDTIIDNNEILKIRHEIIEKATKTPTEAHITISLEDISKKAAKELLKTDFKNIPHNKAALEENILQFKVKDYIETNKLPMFWIDEEKKELRCRIGDDISILTETPADPNKIFKALEDLENVFNTVDTFGQVKDTHRTKKQMFESLLYIFWSPFIHRQMKYREQNDAKDEKGIPFLFIEGETNSGKSTYVNYLLSLVVGVSISSLKASDTKVDTLTYLSRQGNSYPLIIDDVDGARIGNYRKFLSGYWQKWDINKIYPGIIFTSNTAKPDDWLASRIIHVNFTTKFSSDPETLQKLNRLKSVPNPIFRYFSYLILHNMKEESMMKIDVLKPARDALIELYNLANRPRPKYFPENPVEYNTEGKRKWGELIEGKRITITERDNKLIIDFGKDADSKVIKELYRDLDHKRISANIGHNAITIKNPETFKEWIGWDSINKKNIREKIKRLIKR